MEIPKPEWAIYYGTKRYFDVAYKTKEEAERELADLLRPYPPSDLWRRKLAIDEWPKRKKPVEGFNPPYGYVRVDSEHYGYHLIQVDKEQRVIRFIRLRQKEGTNSSITARGLNQQGYRTRDREKFTKSYVERILAEQPPETKPAPDWDQSGDDLRTYPKKCGEAQDGHQ